MTDLRQINALDGDSFVNLFGGVFEHATWVAQTAYARKPFANVHDLHGAMMAAVREAPAETRLAFLNGHPELAGPEARAKAMTVDSAQEQGSAGLDRLSQADAEAFDRLNAAYRSRFGFPFIVAVRGRALRDILVLFEQRLYRSQDEEEATALEEISAITRMRLEVVLERHAPGAPA